MGNAIQIDAMEEFATQCFNVPINSGSKKRHTMCPILLWAFARNVAHVLSLAL